MPSDTPDCVNLNQLLAEQAEAATNLPISQLPQGEADVAVHGPKLEAESTGQAEATPLELDDVRPGDTVTRTGTVGHLFAGGFTVDWSPGVWENIDYDTPGFTFTRPSQPPLPTVPATVIEATIPGGTRAQLVLTTDDTPPWFAITADHGRRWYSAQELTDHMIISTPGGDQ